MNTEDMETRVCEIELEAQGRYMEALEAAGEPCYWSDLADTERHEAYLEDEDREELHALRRRLDVAHHEPTD